MGRRRLSSLWPVAAAIAPSILLLIVLIIGFTIPIRRGYNPQYRWPHSVASLERVTLGGSPQWILIRSENTSNPLLLFLHGGPGMPTMYLTHSFQRELEKSFVVVDWDRRGAGKSFTPGMSSQKMSVSQEMSDTLELIDQMMARFHQPKVYLVGFSYGTYLGILIAQRAPERLNAYVGIGQLACSEKENRVIQDDWIRREAIRTHNQGALDQLNGRKPYDREQWLFKYGGEIHSATSWWPLLWNGLRAPEYTFRDILNLKAGVDFTARNLRYDVINGSILDNVSAVEVPVYFFTGRFDYTDPTSCTVKLFEKISALMKKLIWFDRSAHFVFLDEPVRFAAEMRRVLDETRSSNQSMKPTAALRNKSSVIATTPCRGLSPSH